MNRERSFSRQDDVLFGVQVSRQHFQAGSRTPSAQNHVICEGGKAELLVSLDPLLLVRTSGKGSWSQG